MVYCNYWDQRPARIRRSFEKWVGGPTVPAKMAMSDYLTTENVQSVLDLGAGLGDLKLALDSVGYQGLYFPVELSQTLIKMSHRKYPELSLKFSEFDISETWPIPDKAHHAVLTRHTLEHNNEYPTILSEMSRVTQNHILISLFCWSDEPKTQLRIKKAHPDIPEHIISVPEIIDSITSEGFSLVNDTIIDPMTPLPDPKGDRLLIFRRG